MTHRVQFDATGNLLSFGNIDDGLAPKADAQPPGQVSAQIGDVGLFNRQSKAITDSISNPNRAQQDIDLFNVKADQFVELDDIIAVHEQSGRKPLPSMLERRERIRHDLLILKAKIGA